MTGQASCHRLLQYKHSCPTVSDVVDCKLGREYLEIQKDVNLGVLKLVDHLCDPGVVQEIYVLKPAALHSKHLTPCMCCQHGAPDPDEPIPMRLLKRMMHN